MLLSQFIKTSSVFANSFCAHPIEMITTPEREYILGAGYDDSAECEPVSTDIKGYLCGLTAKEFDESCVDSNVSKLVLINCPDIDFACSCFKMKCGPWEGKTFSIFRKGTQEFIVRDKTNTCVEVYVVEVC